MSDELRERLALLEALQDTHERGFEDGHQAAWRSILSLALRELPHAQEWQRAERHDTRKRLEMMHREITGESPDWAEDLHLADCVRLLEKVACHALEHAEIRERHVRHAIAVAHEQTKPGTRATIRVWHDPSSGYRATLCVDGAELRETVDVDQPDWRAAVRDLLSDVDVDEDAKVRRGKL